jgi:hypothetical protein
MGLLGGVGQDTEIREKPVDGVAIISMTANGGRATGGAASIANAMDSLRAKSCSSRDRRDGVLPADARSATDALGVKQSLSDDPQDRGGSGDGEIQGHNLPF